ncbi:amidohydrolase family protein [Sediminicola sp. 1XM1-17]|uniref:amidohydrolase family protein n=1 Tax=Sediminicola sp. 1XM1-17 TaxID=3127702 RepID=UPI00307794CA
MRTVSILLWLLFLLSCGTKEESGTVKEAVTSNTHYTGPIIDMHSHAFGPESGLNRQLGRAYTNPLTEKTYVAAASMEAAKNQTLEIYRKHNVVKAMVGSGELWTEEAPELVMIGNGYEHSINELRHRHSAGKLQVLGEVAPNYEGILPTDEKMAPYFDLAEELQIPIAYHLYPGGPPGGAYFAYPMTRAIQGKPLQMEEVLFARPEMKIYIMHAGWPYLEDMKALMFAHLQVYVDVGVINWMLPRAEFHHFLKGLVDAGFGKRIMFGVDQMVWPQSIEEAIESIQSADFLTLEQKADIFYNNAARFMDFPEEMIQIHKNIAVGTN